MGDDYMIKIKNAVINYVENVVGAKDLVVGKDYEIISKVILTNDFDTYSLEDFNKSGLSNNLIIAADETPLPDEKDFSLYLLNEEVDISLATECSLGVVEFLTGEHEGKFGVYFIFYGTDEEWDNIDEIIALSMYLQLKHPEVHFDNLNELFDEHFDLIVTLFLSDVEKHMARLTKIFNSYKK